MNMKDQLESLVGSMDDSGIFYSEAVREFKKRFIKHVLKRHSGNQCKAARELGMHRNTLSRTIAELKIDIREFRPRTFEARLPVRAANTNLQVIVGQAG
jgi:Fis family transcriptional regulator